MLPSTPVIIVIICLAAGMIDIVLAYARGNQGTISRTLLAAQGQQHILAGLVSYAFVGLMVHLFWPTIGPAPHFWGGLWRALVFLTPVFYALEQIAIAMPDPDGVIRPIGAPVLAIMLIGGFLGGAGAKLLVPQHIVQAPPLIGKHFDFDPQELRIG